MAREWWHGAVGYEIYPRSFADSNGDGIGDLAGIRSKLEYVAWLGVDAVWITPFYETPGFDHGYDVSNYVAVDPVHGTLDDFDALVAHAHHLGLRVIVDIVPNHTSSHHPWFQSAIKDPTSHYRNYYIWHDPAAEGGPPNNWVSHFGGPAWTLDDNSDQYYCHLFLPEQPDLNWANPAVGDEFAAILRFWCERGVDGFRIDVAHSLTKDPHFRSNPQIRPISDDMDPGEVFNSYEHRYDLDQNTNIHIFRRWNRVVAEYGAMLLGEVGPDDPIRMARYHDDAMAIHRNFYLSTAWLGWEPQVLRNKIRGMATIGGDSTAWIIDNHDTSRSATRYGGGDRGRYRSLCITTLLFALGGFPFLWQGQELALEDGVIRPEDLTDPISTRNENASGRDGTRTVMPWDTTRNNGFTTADHPWQRAQDRPPEFTVAGQRNDPTSWLNRHRSLLALRKELPDLVDANARWIDGDYGLMLTIERGAVIVSANLDEYAAIVELPAGAWKIAFTSRDDGASIDDRGLILEAETAAIVTKS